MLNLIIIILLGFFCGLAKATRDTIAHHWSRSIFSKIKNEKLLNWFKSYWKDKPNHYFWFLWDGWHASDSLGMLCCLIGMIVVTSWLQVGLFYILYGAAFNLCYHKLFLISE